MVKVWIPIAALISAAGFGYYASTEHAARVHAEQLVHVWQDSVHVKGARADSSVAALKATIATYNARPARVIDHYHTVTDSIIGEIPVTSPADSARLDSLKAVVANAAADCKARDSLARVAQMQTTLALAQKDDEIAALKAKPKEPGPSRFGLVATGAYDPVAHGVYAGARAELRLGPLHPFVSAGATVAQTTRGQVLAGVEYVF